MRAVTAVLVLILAACSTAGGTTTTTAPPPEPSTSTTTTALASMRTAETSTPTEDECIDRDGVMRTLRGFVCPPYLRTFGPQRVTPGYDTHLAGTFILRQFTPAMSFTRAEPFVSSGENAEVIEYDNRLGCGWYAGMCGEGGGPAESARHMISYSAHEELAHLLDRQPFTHDADWTWAADVAVTKTTVGGFPTTVTTFTADCPQPRADTQICAFDLAGIDPWYLFDGQRTALVVVDLPEEPFTILVEAQTGFDAYWTEVAQPILGSIEFVDQ